MSPLFILLADTNNWGLFIGRFHPLLVHLPIGFLFLVLFLEVAKKLGKLEVPQSVTQFVILLSAISATISCIVGFLLGDNGGYEQELLGQHQWAGIFLAIVCWIAYLARHPFIVAKYPLAAVAYYPAYAFSFILLMITGHLGGNLTHGETYLTQYVPEPFRGILGLEAAAEEEIKGIKPIENIENALVYEDIVQPLLDARCVQCHGSSKQKGKLRLDSFDQIAKGGENGEVIKSGNGIESSLVALCLLPVEDEMHMPPKGKTQLTTSQITLLRWWIDAGIPRSKKVAELKPTDEIIAALGGLSNSGNGGAVGQSEVSLIEGLSVSAGDVKSIDGLKKLNLLVVPVAKEQNLLEVNAVNAPGFSDANASLLSSLAEQIVWLKLGGTQITDAIGKELVGLKNLNKLNLENTGIGNALISSIQGLTKLESINLIGTKVSNESIKSIAAIKSLRRVYVWKSEITAEGIAELKSLRPDINVVGGLTDEEVKNFLTTSSTNETEKAP